MTSSEPFHEDTSKLLAMLRDLDVFTRERAAYALGRCRENVDILLALGEALFDSDDEVCIAAAVSLFGMGSRCKPVLTQLIKALHHRNLHVRCLVAATLGSIGTDAREAVPLLIKRLDSPDPRERYWVAHALKTVGETLERPGKRDSCQEPFSRNEE
jgi:HEAT repeat protein